MTLSDEKMTIHKNNIKTFNDDKLRSFIGSIMSSAIVSGQKTELITLCEERLTKRDVRSALVEGSSFD